MPTAGIGAPQEDCGLAIFKLLLWVAGCEKGEGGERREMVWCPWCPSLQPGEVTAMVRSFSMLAAPLAVCFQLEDSV